MPAFSSGRLARTSQLSATFCPVLVPPWIVRALVRRLSVTSKPLKYWYHSPYFSASVARLSTCPDLAGTTSKSVPTGYPPPPGSRESDGAVIVYGRSEE